MATLIPQAREFLVTVTVNGDQWTEPEYAVDGPAAVAIAIRRIRAAYPDADSIEVALVTTRTYPAESRNPETWT